MRPENKLKTRTTRNTTRLKVTRWWLESSINADVEVSEEELKKGGLCTGEADQGEQRQEEQVHSMRDGEVWLEK